MLLPSATLSGARACGSSSTTFDSFILLVIPRQLRDDGEQQPARRGAGDLPHARGRLRPASSTPSRWSSKSSRSPQPTSTTGELTDVLVVSTAWAPYIFPGMGNYSAIRAVRVLRALRTVNRIRRLNGSSARCSPPSPSFTTSLLLPLWDHRRHPLLRQALQPLHRCRRSCPSSPTTMTARSARLTRTVLRVVMNPSVTRPSGHLHDLRNPRRRALPQPAHRRRVYQLQTPILSPSTRR